LLFKNIEEVDFVILLTYNARDKELFKDHMSIENK